MAGWAGGIFTRARNWVTDKNGAINPQAALFDQEDDNFASGLNNCVTKDGLNKPSATMDWNSQILKNLGNAMFNAQRTGSDQALGNNTVTDVLFNTANSNQGSGYATGTGIFTAPLAGLYIFTGAIALTNATGTQTLNGVYFSKNNATAVGASRFDFALQGPYSGGLSLSTNKGYTFNGSIILLLAAADTVRVKADIGAASLGSSVVQQNSTFFSGYMLG